jgi:hypothetical protein
MSHRHAGDDFIYEDGHVDEPRKCVEISPNVCLQPVNGGGEGIRNASGEPVVEYFAGFIMGHDRAGFDVRCEGFVGVSPDHGARWTMTGTLEGGDLMLSPSILCRLGNVANQPCGFHGFIREGKWVPA